MIIEEVTDNWQLTIGNCCMNFPKTDRILKRADFRRVYEEGQKFQARCFTAFVLPGSGERSRIGITATRKNGNAVERNRARRMVREVSTE